MKIVNYLDVILDFFIGKFCSYRKSDNYLLYINVKFNYLFFIIKYLSVTISIRILGLFCDFDEFNKVSRVYNDVLKISGYRESL